MTRITIIVVLAFVFFSLGSLGLFGSFFCLQGHAGSVANEIEREEQELKELEERLRETRDTIKAIGGKETTLLGELEGINRKLSKDRGALRRVAKKLTKTERRITSKNKEIRKLEKASKKVNKRLWKRLGAIYKIENGALMSAVMPLAFAGDAGQGDTEVNSTGKNHKYLSIIMESDKALIKDAKSRIERLSTERRKLRDLRSEMKKTKRLASIKTEVTKKRSTERSRLLVDVRRKKENHLKLLTELEESSRELGSLIERFRSQGGRRGDGDAIGFFSMKGRLPMPVKGRVVSRYGKVTHPRFKTVTFNNGIVIESSLGTKARSVYPGTVVYVGWLKGYGQVMIIDHGGGFYTLFAQLSEILKKRGQDVKEGTVVGLVGDSGVHVTPGLYFEVRQGGSPKDPLQWLAKK